MSSNFGLKIGIDGEREFKSALRDINQSFKVLGSEMNLVTSQFGKQDKSIEAITSRNKVLNKEIELQKDKVSTLERALKNSSDSFGENDKRTKAWQIQLNNANADLNKMEKELGDNNRALNTAGKEFDKAENEAGEFGDEVKKAGDKADDAGGRFKKLGRVVKGIGVAMASALAALGAASIAAGKALVDMTVDAAKYADEILTLSTVTGMSTDSLQAYKYAAELVDVSMETLTGSMSRQVKSMSSARDGSKAMSDAYGRLGVSVADSNGELRNAETVYWETIDALGKMTNETERDALAMQIFGKSARELNPLIAKGSEGIAELTDEAKRMGLVMDGDSLTALGNFDDSLQKLKSGIGGAKNMLGMVLLPQLQILADDGVGLLGNFTSGLQDAGGDWDKISDVIGSTIGGFVSMILENLPKIVQLGLDIVLSIVKAIAKNLPMIIDAAVSIVMTLIDGLIEVLPAITEGAILLVISLLNGILDALPMLVEAAIIMVVTLAQGIAKALPELIPKIVDAVILIVKTLIDNLDLILDAAMQLIVGLARGLVEALPRLMEALPKIIISIVDFIANNLPLIIELGIEIVIMLAKGLIEAIPLLLLQLPEIITAILTGLGKALVGIGQVGMDLIKGLWEGMLSMDKWLSDKVKGFFGGVVGGIKNLLGVKSPSTVFAGIGVNMGEGIGVGFLDAMKDVERDMQSAIPTDFDIDADVSGIYPQTASGSFKNLIEHSGIIQVRGIDNKNNLVGVVDIVMDQLRREARLL